MDCRLDDLLRARAIRRLIGIEITDAITATAAGIAAAGLQAWTTCGPWATTSPVSRPDLEPDNAELKRFLMRHFYRHPRVMRMATKAHRLLTALFDAYLAEPLQLPYEIQARIERPRTRPSASSPTTWPA